MKLIEALESGACGVSFKLPKGAVVRASEVQALAFTEDTLGLEWLIHFGDVALDLDPNFDELLARDIDDAARAIMAANERNIEGLIKQGKLPRGAVNSRVSDAAWSPVIDARPVAVDTASGIEVMHRTVYRSGLEAVMGHLLVPVAKGVVEFRVTVLDRANHGREKVVTDASLSALDAQRAIDDASHDAAYPKHPVSRVRAALAGLREAGRIEVLRAPLEARTGSVALEAFGGSLTLPPRFALAGEATGNLVLFTRMSLANTDGVWRLVAAREDVDGVSRHRPLRKRVEEFVAANFGLDDLSAAKVELRHADDGSARVWITFEPQGPMTALASVWWLHSDMGLRGLQLSAPNGVSLASALALFEPTAASWRVEGTSEAN